jgi:hypothetical protein
MAFKYLILLLITKENEHNSRALARYFAESHYRAM